MDRGMSLIEYESRCVRRGETHELVTTDEHDRKPNQRINRVGFLGFIEIENAGLIERGDVVLIGDRRIGCVAGFDDCHFPNHYNIVLETKTLFTGLTIDLRVEDAIVFSPVDETKQQTRKHRKQYDKK
jgi:hypothetical protein